MLEYAAFLHGIGLIDKNERQFLELIQNEIRYPVRRENWFMGRSILMRLKGKVDRAIGSVNYYDYRRDNTDIDKSYPYIELVKKDKMRRRMHVGPLEYELCSFLVRFMLMRDDTRTVRPWIEELLEDYPMLIYSGQFEMVCPPLLTENHLDKLNWSGALQYSLAKKQLCKVGNKLAGHYKSSGNLVYAVVRNAGHMVPYDQPENTLDLIDRFISKKLRTVTSK